MIDLIPAEGDDLDFLALIGRIINGSITALEVREVYLVGVDNWFDHKWLGWRSWSGKGLCIPMFDPNRIHWEKRFIWDGYRSEWSVADLRGPLHRDQPGRDPLAQPIDRVSKSAAFIWYSGKSATDRAGSLMFYLSGADGYSWYASFINDGRWKIHGEREISRRQLLAFEDRGRELVPVNE